MPLQPEQLELVENARVEVEYDPMRPAPDAKQPGDVGCYAARLVGGPCGEGRTEQLALEALARALRSGTAGELPRPGVTAVSQALNAARSMDRDELIAWLAERARDAILYESPGAAFAG